MSPFRIEKLARHHALDVCDCGEEALDRFLLRFAFPNQQASASQTYLGLAGEGVSAPPCSASNVIGPRGARVVQTTLGDASLTAGQPVDAALARLQWGARESPRGSGRKIAGMGAALERRVFERPAPLSEDVLHRRASRSRLLTLAVRALLAVSLSLLASAPAYAQDVPGVSITVGTGQGPEQLVPALKVLLLMTVLSLAPAIIISMTSFTRIVVVLSFMRQAVGSQNVPPTQVILALSLLLTVVVMTPVATEVHREAIVPYTEKVIDEATAWEAARVPMTDFLLRQTRPEDLKLFYDLSKTPAPATANDVAIHLAVPAFMISELRTGFEMGFLLFLPFALIDLIVASLLTAMGMMMLPPTTLSTPLKLLLFVAVDGWALLTRSLVSSFL